MMRRTMSIDAAGRTPQRRGPVSPAGQAVLEPALRPTRTVVNPNTDEFDELPARTSLCNIGCPEERPKGII